LTDTHFFVQLRDVKIPHFGVTSRCTWCAPWEICSLHLADYV